MQDINRAIKQLQNGMPIIVYDSDDRESEGDLLFSAKFCTPELVNLCLTHGKGLICVSLSPEEAIRIGVQRLQSNNKDVFSTPFGMPVNLADESSGISASARSATISAMSDVSKTAVHFSYPGHVHTLIAHPDGLKARKGHTEAARDLLKLAGIDGPGVLCEILKQNGEIAYFKDLQIIGEQLNLPVLTIESIIVAMEQTTYETEIP